MWGEVVKRNPIYWIELLLQALKQDHDMVMSIGDDVRGINLQDAYDLYTKETGTSPATKEERQQAILSYVLSENTHNCAKCKSPATFYVHGWAEDGQDEGYVKVPLCAKHKAELDKLIVNTGEDDEIDYIKLNELTGLEYITDIEEIEKSPIDKPPQSVV